MAESVIGNPAGLSFELAWDDRETAGTSAEATRGQLRASLAGSCVWGTKGRGFSWTWIELLEHLVINWRWIEWEEVDPLGLASSINRLRSEAEHRWEGVPGARRDDEEELLWTFEQRHNLSAALQGAWLRDLWLLRCGDEFQLSGANQELWQDAPTVLATLESLGSEIASRISDFADERAKQAVLGWESRRAISVDQFVSTATSLDPNELDRIARGKDPRAFWELGDKLEPTEILAAARMAGPLLAPADVRAVLERVRRLRPRATPELDRLVSTVPLLEGKVFDQGYRLAIWLREQMGNAEDRIEPEDVLRSWRIEIKDIDLASKVIDAISCWGPRHGPAIILNGRGQHAGQNHGRRSTLAHEICHLILDRKTALPLVEVFGGRVSKPIEARARAFAAEFLLPRSVAVATLRRSTNMPAAVRRLRERFGVSPEIIAWQARNSDEPMSAEQNAYLQGLVSDPSLF